MDDRAQAILPHLDPRELVDLARALIRIPSFKREETAVALVLETFFRQRGYDADVREMRPVRDGKRCAAAAGMCPPWAKGWGKRRRFRRLPRG